jgi:hypothetical protein
LIGDRDVDVEEEVALRVRADVQVLGERPDGIGAVERGVHAGDRDRPADVELRGGEELDDGVVVEEVLEGDLVDGH